MKCSARVKKLPAPRFPVFNVGLTVSIPRYAIPFDSVSEKTMRRERAVLFTFEVRGGNFDRKSLFGTRRAPGLWAGLSPIAAAGIICGVFQIQFCTQSLDRLASAFFLSQKKENDRTPKWAKNNAFDFRDFDALFRSQMGGTQRRCLVSAFPTAIQFICIEGRRENSRG